MSGLDSWGRRSEQGSPYPLQRICLILIGCLLLHLTVVKVAVSSEAPDAITEHKVWGTVVPLEANNVLVVRDPAGLEIVLHADRVTLARLRAGDPVKALVDEAGRVVFIEVVHPSDA